MRAMFFSVLVVLLLAAFQVQAQTVKGDVDGNGRVDLNEAVYALQVTAGLSGDPGGASYDISEYLPQVGTKHYYQNKYFAGNAGDQSTREEIIIVGYKNEVVNEQEVLMFESGGSYDYFAMKDSELLLLGYGNDYGSSTWYDPPVVTGSTNMKVGQSIYNMYVSHGDYSKTIQFREYILLGTEEVTVPAGTFQCLKIFKKRSYGGRHEITYWAKSIGEVKWVNANDSGGGFIQELVNVESQDGTMLYGNSICTVDGTWSGNNNTSGTLSMVYVEGQKIAANLFLNDYPSYPGFFYLVSTNGTDFTPSLDAYPDQNYDGQPDEVPDINLTINNGAMTGKHTLYDQDGNPQSEVQFTGTVTCR